MVMDTPGPRRLLIKCLHEGPQAVIQEESLWFCTICHVCEDRCPQEIHITDLLTALMNLASRKGNVPERVKAAVETIARTGRSVVTYRVDEERLRLGLKPLGRIDTHELEIIAARTGLLEKKSS